ncbi:MAG: Glucose-1-phosphate thymidylyltransferase [uncultured Acidimicrobiales bacterium]|uniref:Glucose-1-phosphate thymidylyltransferase n=1 Tax=uncultured Acidimicrobiales bacterium TaxID=310071 RepID=A0A6J4GZP9_9ACTN|nr:MAG: Glucose-1-phosphate thymidylyltransferase [uncultured Acidimicrobiales bacterium]
MPLVGLVPAGGVASRLGAMPCSKEILPVGIGDGPGTARVACDPLLEAFASAGVRRCVMVLGHGKWDVPAFLGDGSRVGLDLAYLTVRESPNGPTTLDRAYEHVRGCRVVFGFPDILIGPSDLFDPLVQMQEEGGADVVLGLFPAADPSLVDMVELDDDGRVRAVLPKPEQTSLRYTWLVAVWGAAFTELLHDGAPWAADGREVYVGDVINAAVRSGLTVMGSVVPDGHYLDVGTPAKLAAALRGELGGDQADQAEGTPRPTAST